MANSADPDQLASSEANWSGSTLFAKQGISGLSKSNVNLKIFDYIKHLFWGPPLNHLMNRLIKGFQCILLV